jgi:pyrimidine operon attenuation protein / uracil phosphoribosyltransferase
MQLDADKLIEALAEKIGTLADGTVIIGIHTGGAWVAKTLAARLQVSAVGALAVTLHRDDYGRRGLHPQKNATDIPFAIDDADVLLVDDVLQSGRTIRAALNELFDYGRPKSVRLAVLIDRGGRELPIAPDYVAVTMPLAATERLTLSQEGGALRFAIREA